MFSGHLLQCFKTPCESLSGSKQPLHSAFPKLGYAQRPAWLGDAQRTSHKARQQSGVAPVHHGT